MLSVAETGVEVKLRKGFTLHAQPPGAGKIVGMVNHGDAMYVACEGGVFRLIDGKFEPIKFVEDTPKQTA